MDRDAEEDGRGAGRPEIHRQRQQRTLVQLRRDTGQPRRQQRAKARAAGRSSHPWK
jgi:hypothetical protein